MLLSANVFGQGAPSILWARPGVSHVVSSVDFAPDGQTIAYVDSDAALKIVRVADGMLVKTIRGATGPMISCDYSPDGSRIAYNRRTPTGEQVEVVRVSDGVIEHSFSTPFNSDNEMLMYSPNGRYLAKGRLWDLQTGTEIQLRTASGDPAGDSWPVSCFTPDSSMVLTSVSNQLCATSDGHYIAHSGLPGGSTLSATRRYSPDGSMIAIAGAPNGSLIYSTSTGALLKTLPFNAVSIDWHGSKILFGTWSTGLVILVDTANNFSTQVLFDEDSGSSNGGYMPGYTFARFSSDAAKVVSGSRTVHVFNTADPSQATRLSMQTFHSGGAGIMVAHSPDGTLLASVTYSPERPDQSIRLWHPTTGALLGSIPVRDNVSCMAWAPDSVRIVVGYYDGGAEVWNVQTGTLHRTLNPGGGVYSVAVSRGKYVALAVTGFMLHVYRLDSSYHKSRSSAVGPVAFTPDGSKLIVSELSAAGGAAILNATDITQPHLAALRNYSTLGLTISKDGSRLAFGRRDKASVYHLSTIVSHDLNGLQNNVNRVALTHNGGLLLVGDEQANLRFLDALDGTIVKSFDQEIGKAPMAQSSYSISPSGSQIAIGRSDGTVLVIANPFAGLVAAKAKVASLPGGSATSVRVTLDNPAPAGGASVQLSASPNGVLTVPTTVTVPAGLKTADANVMAIAVDTDTLVTVTARLHGAIRTTSITVTRAALHSLVAQPSTLVGGNSLTATWTLNGPAGPSGVAASSSSSDPSSIAPPANLTIPAGAKQAKNTLTTAGVDASTTVTLTSTASGVSRSALVTVQPADLIAATTPNSTVTAGARVRLNLTLNGSAGPSGGAVTITSSHPAIIANTSASFVAGANRLSRSLPTKSVGSSTVVTLTVTYKGVSKTLQVTVNP